MAPLRMTAAQHVALHVTTVITNPAAAVCRMLVPVVQNNAQEEFRRRVQVVYGLAVQNALQIRFAVLEIVIHAVQTSTSGTIHAKITVHRIADRMAMHVPKTMQQQHAQVAHVFIHAKPIIAM